MFTARWLVNPGQAYSSTDARLRHCRDAMAMSQSYKPIDSELILNIVVII